MKEQFVTYEIALALKELGFDKSCLAYFDINYDSITQKYTGKLILGKDPEYLTCQRRMHYMFGQQICLAPLWQQAIDWFREKYKINISLIPWNYNTWWYQIESFNDNTNEINSVIAETKKIISDISYYDNRKQAILKAIEIIKQENN